MRKGLTFSITLFLISCIFLNNCTKAPVYPDTPEIEFRSISQKGDSIFIDLNFKDGDGDLGIGADEISSPFHEFQYKKDAFGNYIEKGSVPGMPPYNCKNYLLGDYDTDQFEDTVWIETNPNYNNYFLDFYIRNPDGSYSKFDFSSFCFDFNQRFPLLFSKEDNGPIEGTLTYKTDLGNIRLSDPDVIAALSNKYIKFKVSIQDRKMNRSNEVETSEIFFSN